MKSKVQVNVDLVGGYMVQKDSFRLAKKMKHLRLAPLLLGFIPTANAGIYSYPFFNNIGYTIRWICIQINDTRYDMHIVVNNKLI